MFQSMLHTSILACVDGRVKRLQCKNMTWVFLFVSTTLAAILSGVTGLAGGAVILASLAMFFSATDALALHSLLQPYQMDLESRSRGARSGGMFLRASLYSSSPVRGSVEFSLVSSIPPQLGCFWEL